MLMVAVVVVVVVIVLCTSDPADWQEGTGVLGDESDIVLQTTVGEDDTMDEAYEVTDTGALATEETGDGNETLAATDTVVSGLSKLFD